MFEREGGGENTMSKLTPNYSNELYKTILDLLKIPPCFPPDYVS